MMEIYYQLDLFQTYIQIIAFALSEMFSNLVNINDWDLPGIFSTQSSKQSLRVLIMYLVVAALLQLPQVTLGCCYLMTFHTHLSSRAQ